jgi:hypothetical protein
MLALVQCGSALAALPSDPLVPQQQPLRIMHVGKAMANLARPLKGVKVTVDDTGLDLDHPDIRSRLFSLKTATPAPDSGGFYGTGNTPIIPAGGHGWDLIGNDCNPPNPSPDANPNHPPGCSGHGTAVAGILGAAWNNGVGGAGVAPNARFIAIRACWDGDQCYGYIQPDVIDWVAARGARVVTFSWLGGYDLGIDQAIGRHPRTLFVGIPSGNGGAYDADTSPEGPPFPCALNRPNLICVSTSSPTDGLDCGAFGHHTVDVAVPTRNSRTTINGGGFGATGCATSYASPTAGGVAAILFGLVPSATGAQVRKLMIDSARDVPAWQGRSVSGGIVDARRAVNLMQSRFGLN